MTESFEKMLSAIRHYCNYQERCHHDVRYKLVALGARGEELETLLAAMIAENLLDEERFARSYVRGKFSVNHWGKIKIVQHLKQKQVSEYCIRKGLMEIADEDYIALALQLTQKKLSELKNEQNTFVQKQKIMRYLMQKGFENGIIQSVFKEIL